MVSGVSSRELCSLTPSRAPTSKNYKNVYEKIIQKYECIDDVKMHAHAKFEDENSFVQEETKC